VDRPSRKPKSPPSQRRGRNVEALKAPWRAFLQNRRLHDSKVREVIVDVFLESEQHVDLQMLLDAARARNPGVSLATVYRTMRLLEEAGLAHARDFGSGSALYEVAVGRDHHDHLICEKCGQIEEFFSEEIEELQRAMAERHGFSVVKHRHELYGRCKECRSKETDQA
jgi:Fur family transcriptional regulator, ferric uptake regulator